ncbi:MAG TPA: adenylate/guanylate cyclase domain-containing protein [Candidatus Tumulicola sp.]|nr:adenylate/guanylate cyclase domain-containing protein [Candidatus Tumulicola sp.]
MTAPDCIPGGTVTFLFSDIEGSARRWERDPEAMAAALARHNDLLREAIEANAGYVFKTIGDAFCAVFATAADAMRAALRGQRAMIAEDFSAVDGVFVRMALHAGFAQLREGDYHGPTLNRVARLASIGHGGQTLVSGSAAELLRDAIPEGTELRDLGAHRLKDLARPEHVYQLCAPDLADVFPPLRSIGYLPNNLPQQLTSFVGRSGLLAELKTLLLEHRLVTVVGTGGAGKTRCAIQTGAELLDRFADGVWLVELAPISDPALVVQTIAQTLNVRTVRGEELLTTLTGEISGRCMLIVLDNCEHLVGEARRVTGAIAESCSGVRILATSREPLGVAGERIARMPSLDGSEAVELFVDRARAADDRFTHSADNAPIVRELCRRLDGIPLAVELAAARVRILSPKQLSEKLAERFRVLTGGTSVLPRHQTLRATIDWSFDLLDESARLIFSRLAIFVGGWSLEAAAAVCADRADEWEVLDALASLVDKSLVFVEGDGEASRYDMLVSIREYAGERLVRGGERDATAAKHAQFYAGFVDGLAPLVEALEDVRWRTQFLCERDNVRAAIDWAVVRRGDRQTGLRLLSQIEWPELIADPQDALRWYDAAIDAQDATPNEAVRARLLRHRLYLEWLVGRPIPHRETTARAALAAAQQSGDANEAAFAEANLAATLAAAGRFDEAEAAFARAYAHPEALSRITLNAVLRMWAVSNLQGGDVAAARRRFSEVARLERPGSEAHASALLNLSELEYAAGNVGAARATAVQALDAYGALESVYTVLVLTNLSAYAMAAGDLQEARERLRAALELQPRSGSGWLAGVIEAHALFAALHADCERAVLLAGFSDALYRTRGEVRQHTERRGYERLMDLLAAVFAPSETAARMAAGARLTEKEALAAAAAIHE